MTTPTQPSETASASKVDTWTTSPSAYTSASSPDASGALSPSSTPARATDPRTFAQHKRGSGRANVQSASHGHNRHGHASRLITSASTVPSRPMSPRTTRGASRLAAGQPKTTHGMATNDIQMPNSSAPKTTSTDVTSSASVPSNQGSISQGNANRANIPLRQGLTPHNSNARSLPGVDSNANSNLNSNSNLSSSPNHDLNARVQGSPSAANKKNKNDVFGALGLGGPSSNAGPVALNNQGASPLSPGLGLSPSGGQMHPGAYPRGGALSPSLNPGAMTSGGFSPALSFRSPLRCPPSQRSSQHTSQHSPHSVPSQSLSGSPHSVTGHPHADLSIYGGALGGGIGGLGGPALSPNSGSGLGSGSPGPRGRGGYYKRMGSPVSSGSKFATSGGGGGVPLGAFAALRSVRSKVGCAVPFTETNMEWGKLNIFRTRLCDRLTQTGTCHMTNRCLFSHDVTWPRRTPFFPRATSLTFRYIPIMCPRLEELPFVGFCEPSGRIVWELADERWNSEENHRRCLRGDSCPFAHSFEEILFHPEFYKTQKCYLTDCVKHGGVNQSSNGLSSSHSSPSSHSSRSSHPPFALSPSMHVHGHGHGLSQGVLCPWYFCPFAHDVTEERNVAALRFGWNLPPQIVDNEFVAQTQGFDVLESTIIDFVRRYSSSEYYTLEFSPIRRSNRVILRPAPGSSLEQLVPSQHHLDSERDDKLRVMVEAAMLSILLYPVETFYAPALLSLQCALLRDAIVTEHPEAADSQLTAAELVQLADHFSHNHQSPSALDLDSTVLDLDSASAFSSPHGLDVPPAVGALTRPFGSAQQCVPTQQLADGCGSVQGLPCSESLSSAKGIYNELQNTSKVTVDQSLGLQYNALHGSDVPGAGLQPPQGLYNQPSGADANASRWEGSALQSAGPPQAYSNQMMPRTHLHPQSQTQSHTQSHTESHTQAQIQAQAEVEGQARAQSPAQTQAQAQAQPQRIRPPQLMSAAVRGSSMTYADRSLDSAAQIGAHILEDTIAARSSDLSGEDNLSSILDLLDTSGLRTEDLLRVIALHSSANSSSPSQENSFEDEGAKIQHSSTQNSTTAAESMSINDEPEPENGHGAGCTAD